MKKSGLFILILLLIPAISSARSWKAGFMFGGAVSSVDDPLGGTEIKVHPTYLNGIVTLPIGRDRRILTHLFYNDFDLDNSLNKVGGRVKSLGLNATHQWKLRISRKWKPWIGAGLGFSNDTFEDRILLDRDGFILQRLPDREDEAINFVINASMIVKRLSRFNIGVHVQYEEPISGDVRRLFTSVMILF